MLVFLSSLSRVRVVKIGVLVCLLGGCLDLYWMVGGSI